MKKGYYITTTLPYVNAEPHIGFALEIVQADVLARYHAAIGDEVFFNTGTDEHGKKIYEKALEAGKDPQAYVDEYAAKFDRLKKGLNLRYTHFIRTTEAHHKEAAQEMWRLCDKNGYIKKGIYKAKYCVGCELEKTDSELVGGKCPLHPNRELETIEEENYFFTFSQFQNKLLKYFDRYPDFVVPGSRFREIRNFVETGLQDFSISRLKSKMPLGVPVPGDPDHVMYVWFDALTSYISTLGWPNDLETFERFWGAEEQPNAVQVAGTDNLRQQSAMWQAMLMAAGLPPTRQILIHGFITSNGQKMSKSLGNVVDPFTYVGLYGADAVRYFLLAKLHPFDDSDFTREKFEAAYTDDLANGLGNLVARVEAMAEKVSVVGSKYQVSSISEEVVTSLESYRFDEALSYIWSLVKQADISINEQKVWELEGREFFDAVSDLIVTLIQIATYLRPFLPATAEEILRRFSSKKIAKGKPLFPRLG